MKIAILDDWNQDAQKSANWETLAKSHQVDFYHDTVTGEALIERLKPYDILGIMRERTPITEALMAQLPQLKAIVTTGMRNQSLDEEGAKRHGIMLMGTEAPGVATPELAMTLIGNLARNLFANATSMTTGGWQVSTGRDLHGACLGILGLGRLGSAVAKIAQAYGMDVQAWSQNLTKERCEALNVRYVSKDEFFATSDFITIHLKMSERVRHLVGAEQFALMKPTASIVNTSRAGIIDTAALIEALNRHEIQAAAIDVYDSEPVPSDALIRQTPRLLMTPHIGYVTQETMSIFYGQMAENIENYLKGQPSRKLQGF